MCVCVHVYVHVCIRLCWRGITKLFGLITGLILLCSELVLAVVLSFGQHGGVVQKVIHSLCGWRGYGQWVVRGMGVGGDSPTSRCLGKPHVGRGKPHLMLKPYMGFRGS